ncbi:MAG: Omp28-related outer membrane protein [Bacteroidetes bacterium]|nr:Omp28-related outer membrane protein [Bacteroidota bacterium]
MVANGDPVAPIANHNGDPYANTYSNARNSYYGITGFPTVKFDGILQQVGASGNMYPAYKAKVDQRMAVLSNFVITMLGYNNGLNYTVLVTVDMVEPYAGTNLVMQFTITESHIPENWGGLTEVNHVNRLMVPNQNGTALDFSTQTTQSILLNFALNASWVLDNIEFVAFVQNNTGKEILQGSIVAANDLLPMVYNNAGCTALHMVPLTNCSGEVAPQISIINAGADALTTVDINYTVNNEPVSTYPWSGNLAYGESELVDLPPISFGLLDNNDLMIYSSNPNGNADEDTSNDTLVSSFTSAMEVVPNIYVFIKLDDNPGETTWECLNSSGTVLYSGGPYSIPQEFVKDTLFLTDDDCYTFAIYDSGGDGLVGGSSGFTLRQNFFSMIYQNNDFAYSEELVQFEIDQVFVSEIPAMSDLLIYPNPCKGTAWVTFSLPEAVPVAMTVYNATGSIVNQTSFEHLNAGSHTLLISAENFSPGIYFLNLQAGDRLFSRKLTSF